MVLCNGFHIRLELRRPRFFVCEYAEDTDFDDMRWVASECCENKGGVASRAGPLFDQVALIAFQLSSSIDDGDGSIFLEVANGVSADGLRLSNGGGAYLKATGSDNTRR